MLFMHNIINNIPKISVITKIEILRFNTTKAAYKILEDFINISILVMMLLNRQLNYVSLKKLNFLTQL